MGLRGPRKKLAEIDRLDGNPSGKKIREPAIKADGQPAVPDHLDDDAKACVEMIRRSMPPTVYATLDTFALASFAVAWSEHKKCVEALANEPRMIEGSVGQQVLNPWLKHLYESARVMMSLGDRLGLDPKSRAALHTPEQKPASKFEGLIAIAGGRKTS